MVALSPGTPQALGFAAQRLQAGRLVALPTETVYGLAADATQPEAVAQIYAVKGRPSFNPLIIHTHDAAHALALTRANDWAHRLAVAFWPGPLTMILPKAPDCPVATLATAGLDTIAIRVPSNAKTAQVLRVLGRPVAAPSANRSGHVSPTRAEHVRDDFLTDDVLVIDDGACAIGLESTIVDLSGKKPIILRPGGVLREDIERVLGLPIAVRHVEGRDAQSVTAPGQLESHYAPRSRVRLNATSVEADEALLAFGPIAFPHDPTRTINLSVEGRLIGAAAQLFDGLRALDAFTPTAIAVMPVPREGIGTAINDRLARAAAAR